MRIRSQKQMNKKTNQHPSNNETICNVYKWNIHTLKYRSEYKTTIALYNDGNLSKIKYTWSSKYFKRIN